MLLLAFTLMQWKTYSLNKTLMSFAGLKSGDKVDSLDGVYVYYNGSIGHTEGRSKSKNGYNYGLKFQCVEFVKRYYFLHYNHQMPNTYGNALDFYDKKIKDGRLNKDRNLFQYSNPSSKKPKKGDLIVMDKTSSNPYGHVAIISRVTENSIQLVQQNPGPLAPSRVNMKLNLVNDKYQVENKRVLGWLRKK